jgi:hypothetical protein
MRYMTASIGMTPTPRSSVAASRAATETSGRQQKITTVMLVSQSGLEPWALTLPFRPGECSSFGIFRNLRVLECTAKFRAENYALKYPTAYIWTAPKTNRYVQIGDLMRVLGLVAVIGLFLSILDASAASADQCPARDSPIVTDRPDVTNSSLVVPQGSFQSENGISFSQRGGNHEFDGTESRLRWGIVRCLEVLVDLPTYLLPYAVR